MGLSKAQIINRVEKIAAGVKDLKDAGTIPATSEDGLFLLLVKKAFDNEAFTSVFD